MIVTVVTFEPVEDGPHGVGGFDWAYSRKDALNILRVHLNDEEGCQLCKPEGCFNYVIKSVTLPAGVVGVDRVTQWLMNNVDKRVQV